MKKYSFKLFFLVFVLFFTKCKNTEKQDEGVVVDDSLATAVEQTKLNAQNVFNSMPDRTIILKLVAEENIPYKSEFLNDPLQKQKYTIELFKALNLGVYGADLSIANFFNQSQESMIFLKCVNALALDIGVNKAFDQDMVSRMETYKENTDSTLEVITSAFKKADEILKLNNRPGTSALIIAGFWIEGMYVSCETAKDLNKEKIVNKIIDQKESLKNIIVLLQDSKLSEESKFVLNDLKEIYNAFEVAETNTVKNVETIKSIIDKVGALRQKLVAGA